MKYTSRTGTSELELGHTLAFGLEERGWSPVIRPFRIQQSLRMEGLYIVIKLELFLGLRDVLMLWVLKWL